MYERFIVPGLRNWGTPDRKKIGKSLDTEYETLKTQVFKEHFANHDYTTMASDGWSNVRSQPVLNYTITGRKGTISMHAEYPKLVKKDAEYVALTTQNIGHNTQEMRALRRSRGLRAVVC